MNSESAFSQIDNPLILIPQFCYAIGLFVLFVLVRHRPKPIPQLVAVAAFAMLFNFVGRATKAFFFPQADILMFWALCILNNTWVLSVVRQKIAATGAGDATGKSALLSSDLFDTKERQWVSSFVLIALGFILYNYVSNYSEKFVAFAGETTAYFRGYTAAVNKQESHEKKAQADRDSIAYGLRKTAIADSLWRDFVKKDRAQQLAAVNRLAMEVKAKKTPAAPKETKVIVVNTDTRPASFTLGAKINRQVEKPKDKPGKKGKRFGYSKFYFEPDSLHEPDSLPVLVRSVNH